MPPSCEGLMGHDTSQEGPYLLRCTLKYELQTQPELLFRQSHKPISRKLRGMNSAAIGLDVLIKLTVMGRSATPALGTQIAYSGASLTPVPVENLTQRPNLLNLLLMGYRGCSQR